MGRIFSLIAIIVGICYPNLLAHQIPWGEPYEYDLGFNPSIAMDSFTGTVVEVHNGSGQDGPLWYHVGQIDASTTMIQWGSPYQYDVGFNPKVAIEGTTVVEVHNGTGGDGPLWYHVGQIDISTQTIQWGLPYRYDSGFNPSVALSDGGTVVEVHNGTGGEGPLWYHVGQIDATTQKIHWGAPYQYDTGFNPSVTFGGAAVIEVHNGTGAVGPLWYRLGYLDASSSEVIQWGSAHQYDTGFNPSVAFDLWTGTVVEVHNGTGEDGPIWYRAGLVDSSTQTIPWGNPYQYDTGFNPSLALISFGPTPPGGHFPFTVPMVVAEVHNGTGHDGPLWHHLSAKFDWVLCDGAEFCIAPFPY